jgi:hypothetical protein
MAKWILLEGNPDEHLPLLVQLPDSMNEQVIRHAAKITNEDPRLQVQGKMISEAHAQFLLDTNACRFHKGQSVEHYLRKLS